MQEAAKEEFRKKVFNTVRFSSQPAKQKKAKDIGEEKKKEKGSSDLPCKGYKEKKKRDSDLPGKGYKEEKSR